LLRSGITRLAAAAVGSWIVLGALVAARAAGAAIPREVVTAGALAAVVSSAAAACATAARAWRGPMVVDFPPEVAAMCEPPAAEVVRTAALLRGSLGGAGYVHRKRLAFPALAWALATAIAALVARDPGLGAIPVWPFAAFAIASVGTALLPPRPFYYRECYGGSLLLHPAETWIRLGPPNPGRRRWIDPAFRSIEPDARTEPTPSAPGLAEEREEVAEQKTET
jgi:hypothetical protein